MIVRAPDPCGFLIEPALSPLCYASGLPVMRGDEQLLFHARACAFQSSAVDGVISIAAFDPDAHGDDDLARIAVYGAPGVTDLASIPGLFRNLYPPNGRYLKPALKHDHGYGTHGYGLGVARAAVDAELLADMRAVGCGWLERQTIYRAVRFGGGAGWGH